MNGDKSHASLLWPVSAGRDVLCSLGKERSTLHHWWSIVLQVLQDNGDCVGIGAGSGLVDRTLADAGAGGRRDEGGWRLVSGRRRQDGRLAGGLQQLA